ncbi:hypothetical protein ACFX2B_011363 [Malus domestica]
MAVAKSNSSSEASTGLCNCYKIASLTSSILDADETSNLNDRYILGEQSDLLFSLSLADPRAAADVGSGQGGSKSAEEHQSRKTNDESRDLEMDCVRGKWLIEKLKKAKGESCARGFMDVRKQKDNAM